ncbi:hypothetical protein F183_A47950 [Bryobacterales bacterium F-183]|nr:hypothetical protein F183_A47950 [Bryobacterales bacterium F-183]
MDTNAPLEILLVEDDASAGTEIQQSLADLGYVVTHASTGESALEAAVDKKPKLAIVATHLSGTPDGPETARELASQGVSLLFLAASLREARPLLDLKPLGGLVKPLRDGEVEMVLAMARLLMAEREQSQVLAQAMETVTEGIFLLDSTKRIVFANSAALRIAQAERPADGQPLDEFFPMKDGQNEALMQSLQQIQDGAQAGEVGMEAILQAPEGGTEQKVRLWSGPAAGGGITLRFQLYVRPGANSSKDDRSSTMAEGGSAQQPIREKAIRAIELRLEAGAGINHYAAVFTLSQFDTFWTRYGLSNAENLVEAYAAHLTRTFPNERIYRWSNRTIALLLDRESTPPDVRMELTSFTTRRVDYYLNTVGRSALVTLSPAWRLIPLNCDPEQSFDTEEVIRRIEQFEREHTRIR